MTTISAVPQDIILCGSPCRLWQPVIEHDGQRLGLGLRGCELDALRDADIVRMRVELMGWAVACDYERRANASSVSRIGVGNALSGGV